MAASSERRDVEWAIYPSLQWKGRELLLPALALRLKSATSA
jgi:hypothetical protein